MDCFYCDKDGYVVFEDKMLCYDCYIKMLYSGDDERIVGKSQRVKYIKK